MTRKEKKKKRKVLGLDTGIKKGTKGDGSFEDLQKFKATD
jgi:hypothetical protein